MNLYCKPAKHTFSITAWKVSVLWNQKKLTNNKSKWHTRTPTHCLASTLRIAKSSHMCCTELIKLIKGCFAPALAVGLLVFFLPDDCALLMRPNKAIVHGCHCPGDRADRGLVFKCFTCFYCLKGVTFIVGCVKCVPIPVNKQDDPPLWVAENWMTHPLPRAQKLTTQPLCAAANHCSPILFDHSLSRV